MVRGNGVGMGAWGRRRTQASTSSKTHLRTKKDNRGGVGEHWRVAPKLAVLTHTQLRWANNPCAWPPPRRRLRELEPVAPSAVASVEVVKRAVGIDKGGGLLLATCEWLLAACVF